MDKSSLKIKFPRLYKIYTSSDLVKSIIQKILSEKKYRNIDTSNKFEGKIFCIGASKTGTTSVEYALKSFGYRLADQARAEMLDKECYQGNFDRLIRFCYLYDAFQDAPFCNRDYYKALEKAFPESKFILTVRDNEEKWFNSLVNFHQKCFSSTNELPTEDDLENAPYGYKGFVLEYYKHNLDYPNTPLYDKDKYIEIHKKRNQDIKDYFKDKPGKLLVLNLKEENSLQKLGNFLNIILDANQKFPHLNET